MLEKERFLAIKKLARDIRNDNKKKFKQFEDEPVEVAVREKNDFIESIVSNMGGAFSEGEQGKEEKQIFRANILIPDDDEFYETYSKDKNIRNLMNKYSVNIEDIMSKITELNIYGKYLEEDDMVEISPKEAEDLLDEIDSLSNTLTNLDLNLKEYDLESKEDNTSKFITSNVDTKKEVKNEKTKMLEKQKEEKQVVKENDDDFLGDSFDNINTAISGFVTDYNNLKEELKQNTKYITSLENNVKNMTNENDRLKDVNSKYKEENKSLKAENSNLKNENSDLRSENSILNKRAKALEDKLYKSMELLKKVYTGIKD